MALYNLFVKNPAQKEINTIPLAGNPDVILKDVEEKGFSTVFNLNPQLLSDLIADCRTHSCVAEENTQKVVKIDVDKPVNPDETYIKYLFKDAVNWPSVRNIIYNASMLKVAGDYLGNQPVVQNVAIWWSFPKQESMKTNIYNFHYDIDNLKFIKLFTYLTAVDANNGPHIIYPATHKHKTLMQKRYRSVPDEKVSEVLGDAKPVVMTGGSGTSFFEDTFSYHKGLNPIRPRLIFQVEYSLTHTKLG